MTEHLASKLTADEAIRRIAADIRAYPQNGPDRGEEHIRLFGALIPHEEIEALWADRYTEIAIAGRDKLANLSSRLEGFRPKIEEAKRKLAESKLPVVGGYRRYAKATNNGGASSFLPATQPKAEPAENNNAEPECGKEEVVGKFVEEIKASSRALEVVKPFDCLSAEQVQTYLDAMNVRHAVIGNIGGKCRVLEWVPSELDEGAHQLSLQSKTDLIARYAHIQVGWTNRGQPLTLGQKWFEHPQRANYRGVTFRPGKPAVIINRDTGSWLNLWRGWGILPAKGKWPLLRKHVEVVLSGGDPKMADYNIRWTAWGFQNPGDLPEAALVLRGKKGGGKGIWLGTILFMVLMASR